MRIEPMLRRIHHRQTEPAADHADALEAELMSKFQARPVRRRKVFWLLGGAALALAGACVAPASYEMDVGYRMTIAMELDSETEAIRPDAMATHVQNHFEVDELKVLASKAVRETDEGSVSTMQIQLMLAGPFDIDDVETSLVDSFPPLGEADVEIEVLDGTVRGTVGGLLGHKALGLELDDASIEETRAQILAELQARGLADNATIEITDEETPNGRRREVRVEVEAPAGEVP